MVLNKIEMIRDEIELFMCTLMDNLIEEDSCGFVIEDKETNNNYCFIKENGFGFKEEKIEAGLLLHIRDNENEVTIKLNNNSDLKASNNRADVFVLDDRFMFGCL
jgi:hypothetical protein